MKGLGEQWDSGSITRCTTEWKVRHEVGIEITGTGRISVKVSSCDSLRMHGDEAVLESFFLLLYGGVLGEKPQIELGRLGLIRS